MNVIPVVFAFDNNLVIPASVSIVSLLKNAHKDTFYDIFILHSAKEVIDKSTLDRIPEYYTNCKIQYVTVGDDFDDAFEIRGITTPAYYRLLIPELIPGYEKIIYADADIIFQMDLGELYAIDLKDNYIGAVMGLSLALSNDGEEYMKAIGLKDMKYFQSGFLLMNSTLIRSHNLCHLFKSLARKKFKFQDQDILNISCNNHILSLPLKYNVTTFACRNLHLNSQPLEKYYTEQDIKESLSVGNIHYNGTKPWAGWCYNQDIWWRYYRDAFFYDDLMCFSYYERNINCVDNWSFMKRLKHLLRYFLSK